MKQFLIVVIELGIINSFNETQSLNKSFLMFDKELGKLIEDKFILPSNTLSPK